MLRLRAYSFAFWLLVSQVGGLETSDDTLIKTVLPISAGSPGNRLPVVDSISYYRNQLIMTHKPGVSAHRGSSGDAPENTLATFRVH
ncbi:hypothetical protein [Spirosoma sp. KNUC1025]|uniref:hypothetical protein n=1 Tax=Spirosoma sp. KNUC1025 TaxID=2894082 RepID=UPI003862EB37|nr:hypothetical protein LN737_24345 [Spirosoma sp. KNUC1025]